MIVYIGLAFVAIVTGIVVFCLSIIVMDRLRWWADAGLAAIIPMVAVAFPLAVVAAGFAVWLIELAGQ